MATQWHIGGTPHSPSSSAESSVEDIPLACVKIETMRRLGVPLMGAVIDVRAQENAINQTSGRHPARKEEDARALSSLVRVTMGLMRHISSRLHVNNPEQSVAIKLELASFVAPVVAESYKMHRAIPDAEEMVNILAKMDAVLEQIDVAQLGHGLNLSSFDGGYKVGLFAAGHLEASVPVIQAVSRFNFGMKDDEILRHIMNRLVSRADRFVEQLSLSDASLWNRGALETIMLSSLAKIYADCHLEEIEYLSAMDDAARQEYAEKYNYTYSLDPVWDAFDVRVNMLKVIADHLEFQNQSLQTLAA